MKILFLEDNNYRILAFTQREKDNDLTIVNTADEAIEQLKSERFDVVHLDHDLGGQIYQSIWSQNCGMEVVRWIVENHPMIPKIIIHSWNIPAAKLMEKDLRDAGYDVVRAPFQVSDII